MPQPATSKSNGLWQDKQTSMKTTHSIVLLLTALVLASQVSGQSVVILGNYPPNTNLSGTFPIGLQNNHFYEKAVTFVTRDAPISVTSVRLYLFYYVPGTIPEVGFYTGGLGPTNLVGAFLQNPTPSDWHYRDYTFIPDGSVLLAPRTVYALKASAAASSSSSPTFSWVVGGPNPGYSDYAAYGATYNSGDHGQTFSEVMPTSPFEIRGIALPVPGPSLTVTPETNSVTLSWPSSSTGYLLQESQDLSSTNWTDVAEVPADDGVTLSVNLTSQEGKCFYRLKK